MKQKIRAMDQKRNVELISCVEAFELLDKEFEDPEDGFIGGGLLPRQSILVIGGQSKIGKSCLALHLVICLGAGKPFLLQFPIPDPVRVLFMQAEISERSLQSRIQKMFGAGLQPMPGNLIFCNQKGVKLDNKRHLEQVNFLVERYRPEILAIDPLYKYHVRNEDKSSDMRYLFDNIDSLIVKHGISVVICHHTIKPTEGNTRQGAMMLRGSGTIFDFGDSYITLTRMSGRESRLYMKATFELRNEQDPEPMNIYRNPDTLFYEVISQEGSGTVSVNAVVKALSDLGGRAFRDPLLKAVRERCGVSERTAADAVTRAETLKKIGSRKLETRGRPKEYWTKA